MAGMAFATAALADPRAEIRGEMDAELRAQLVRAVGEVEGPPSNRFEARRRALPAIAAYRDGGCELPPPPSPELAEEMMSFLACTPVDPRVVPMFLEDLHLDGADSGAIRWGDEVPAEARIDAHTVVIGCGEAGLLTGIRLAQAGVPFTSGFIAKFGVIQSAVEEHSYAIAIIAMVSAVIAAFLYLRIMVSVWLEPGDEGEPAERVPLPAGFAVAVAAVFTIVVGIVPGWLLDAADSVSQFAR